MTDIDILKQKSYITYISSETQDIETVMINMISLFAETGIEVKTVRNDKIITINSDVMKYLVQAFITYKAQKNDTQP
jgi:hypothetical protein